MQLSLTAAHTAVRHRTRAAPRQLAWLCAALAAPLAVPMAHAQTALPTSAGPSGGIFIVPSLSVQETLTTNRDLSANGQADAVTQLTSGIRIDSRSGRVQGSLAYSLSALAYARASELSTLQNALDANLRAELVERHVFLDATANVGQQSISAFGTQGRDATSRNANSTEVATVSLSPSVRGNLGGFANATAGANWFGSRSSGSDLGDSSSHSIFAALNGGAGFLLWGLNVNRQTASFKGGRSTQTDQLGGSLTYVARYDLRMTARVGISRSDVLSGVDESKPTTGFSVDWQPTDRTNVALAADRTYYGKSHSFSVVHRMARSVWNYVDSSGISGVPDGRQQLRPLTLYDLYFAICTNAGGDAATCDQIVRAQLVQQQADPATVVTLGFLNSSLTLQRSQLLSVAYTALRTTFTLSAARNETRPLGPTAATGDLAQGLAVRQQIASLGVSHQLTPGAALNLSAAQQTTAGAGSLNGNRLRSAAVGWTLAPGARTSLAFSLRHSRFHGDTGDYTESAVSGSLGLRF